MKILKIKGFRIFAYFLLVFCVTSTVLLNASFLVKKVSGEEIGENAKYVDNFHFKNEVLSDFTKVYKKYAIDQEQHYQSTYFHFENEDGQKYIFEIDQMGSSISDDDHWISLQLQSLGNPQDVLDVEFEFYDGEQFTDYKLNRNGKEVVFSQNEAYEKYLSLEKYGLFVFLLDANLIPCDYRLKEDFDLYVDELLLKINEIIFSRLSIIDSQPVVDKSENYIETDNEGFSYTKLEDTLKYRLTVEEKFAVNDKGFKLTEVSGKIIK